MADKRNKQGLNTIGARTVSPYGCYVNPRAAAGRRAKVVGPSRRVQHSMPSAAQCAMVRTAKGRIPRQVSDRF